MKDFNNNNNHHLDDEVPPTEKRDILIGISCIVLFLMVIIGVFAPVFAGKTTWHIVSTLGSIYIGFMVVCLIIIKKTKQ